MHKDIHLIWLLSQRNKTSDSYINTSTDFLPISSKKSPRKYTQIPSVFVSSLPSLHGTLQHHYLTKTFQDESKTSGRGENKIKEKVINGHQIIQRRRLVK